MASTTSARRHDRRIARLAGIASAGIRRIWRSVEPSSYGQQFKQRQVHQMATFAAAAQVAAVREAESYTTEILDELGIRSDSPTSLNPLSLAGVDGSGRPLESLFELALSKVEAEVDRLAEQYGRELDVEVTRAAMRSVEPWLDGVAQTLVADANRAGELVAMAQRPWLNGFVRVAEPGACSRCIILSGKFFLFSEGFLRHPRCRCNHAPAPDARTPEGKAALDRLLEVESPYRIFESLTREEQNRRFTEAGAEAIRLGADIDQVVNARRGMTMAQFAGRDVLATTEGMTRRGVARFRMQQTTGRRRSLVRLMPETLMAMAGDDVNERVRLLEAHGYIGKTPTMSAGGGSSKPPGPPLTGRSAGESDPPDDDRAAWSERLRRLEGPNFSANGEDLEPDEIRFAERMLANSERLTWIKTGSNGGDDKGTLPTNDFVWHSRDDLRDDLGNDLEVEHKGLMPETPVDAKHIKRQIRNALNKNKRSLVVDSVVVDIGDRDLAPDVLAELNAFYVPERTVLKRLWVMSHGELIQVLPKRQK